MFRPITSFIQGIQPTVRIILTNLAVVLIYAIGLTLGLGMYFLLFHYVLGVSFRLFFWLAVSLAGLIIVVGLIGMAKRARKSDLEWWTMVPKDFPDRNSVRFRAWIRNLIS